MRNASLRELGDTMIDLPRPLCDAICAEPDDDGVRLIAADWLEQEGDPERARFIRWSIKREQLGQDPFGLDPLSENAEYRRLLLSQQNETNRIPPRGVIAFIPYTEVVQNLAPGMTCFTYRRGFLEDIRCHSHRTWMQWGPALVREHPIRTVFVEELEPIYCYLKDRSGRWYVWWRLTRGIEVRDWLPKEFFDRLLIGQPTKPEGMAYHSSADAYRDMSQAMLVWARESPVEYPLPSLLKHPVTA